MTTENETITINTRTSDITVTRRRRSASCIEDTLRTVFRTFSWALGIAAVLVVLGYPKEGLALLRLAETVVVGWIHRSTPAIPPAARAPKAVDESAREQALPQSTRVRKTGPSAVRPPKRRRKLLDEPKLHAPHWATADDTPE